MNKVIYLEPDSEITAVIDRIRTTETDGVVLALPRGSALAHSIVNLKLLKRTAETFGKTIFLAGSDRVMSNLASQVGIAVFAKVSDAESAKPRPIQPVEREEEEDITIDPSLVSSIKVKTYNRFEEESEIAPKRGNQVTEEKSESKQFAGNPFEYEDEELPSEKVHIEAIKYEDEEEPERHEEEQIEEDELSEKSEIVESDKQEDKEPELEEVVIQPASTSKKEKVAPVLRSPRVKGEKERSIASPIITRGKGHRRLLWPILAGSLVIVLVFAGLFYLFIPYATASIILKSDPYQKSLELTVDKNAQEKKIAEEIVMPGKLIEVEKETTKKFLATGKKDVGEKAKGTVTFSNSYSSEDQIVAAGTKLTTAEGKIFILQNAVKIPGATVSTSSCKLVGVSVQCDTVPGTIDGAAVGNETGEDYNIGPSRFSVAGFSSKIYAENKAAFSGGITKQINIVTDDDLSKAEKQLKSEAAEGLKADLVKQSEDSHLRFFENTVSDETISVSATKKVNEESADFDYTVKMKLYAVGFSETDAKSILTGAVEKEISSDQMLINADKAEINFSVIANDNDAGTIKIKGDFSGKVSKKIEGSALASEIKNKRIEQARSILQNSPGVDNLEFKIWPKFMPLVPYLSSHIIIKFDYSI